MKLIIAGGRDYVDEDTLSKEVWEYIHYLEKTYDKAVTEIVCGGAKGADLLGKEYAKSREYAYKEFPAEWNKHGKFAGPIRNEGMADYADALIAFWDGKSKGTKNMIENAKKRNLIVKIIKY